MSNQNSIGDTIAAQATPMGTGGVGIIRISGSSAGEILRALFSPYAAEAGHKEGAAGIKTGQEPAAAPLLPARNLVLGAVCQKDGIFIDECLAVFFPGPHSYTGEDVVEFQCHGGPLVLRKVLTAAVAAGARLAQPGEFTLRAFLNGRMDLTQAEAVLDIITAKTHISLDMAEHQLQGALYKALLPLEEELLDLLAALAAAADFPEEVDSLTPEILLPRLQELDARVEALLAGADAGRIYREGLSVVLLGPANVGKSSLLNALLQEERAIVTERAGTTRDIIEEYFNLDGLPILLSDTAGLRSAEDEAEAIGIGKSRAKAASAQILLLVADASADAEEEVKALIEEFKDRPLLLVLNKIDLADPLPWQEKLAQWAPELPQTAISAKTGAGLAQLKEAILNLALQGQEQNPSLINNLRHQEALMLVRTHLAQAMETLEMGFTLDLAAIDVDLAWQALGEISGKTAGEDVLNRIFERFCIGK